MIDKTIYNREHCWLTSLTRRTIKAMLSNKLLKQKTLKSGYSQQDIAQFIYSEIESKLLHRADYPGMSLYEDSINYRLREYGKTWLIGHKIPFRDLLRESQDPKIIHSLDNLELRTIKYEPTN
jgi:hypothetical protein